MGIPATIYHEINGYRMRLEGGVLVLAESEGELIELEARTVTAILIFMADPRALALIAATPDNATAFAIGE